MQASDERWDRQRRLPGWDQEAIESARCAIAGVGALGNEVVKLLLQLGVRRLAVIDYDRVELSNLNRCIFFNEGDAKEGKLKVEAVAEKVVELFPFARIERYAKKIEELSDDFWSGWSYVFGCLDNLASRLYLNAYTYGRAALIDGGISGWLGKVQVVRAPSACLECALSPRDYGVLWRRYACTGQPINWLEAAQPASPTVSSALASIQVQQFLKLVHGFDCAGRYIFYNGRDQKLATYAVLKRANCPPHSIALKDASNDT